MTSFNKALLSPLMIFLFLFISSTEAKEILVGGKDGAWKVPSSESDSLNKWAEASRFLIGDSLVWTFDPSKDSVLQVSKKDYQSCNTSSPIAIYKENNTKVELKSSGPYYFISGANGHCEKGQKLITVVMSRKRGFIGISPAISPVQFDGPAVAPTSGAVSLKSGAVMGLLLFFVL